MYKVFTKAANCAARKPSRDSYTLKVLLTRLIRRHELFALHIRFKEVMREDIEGSTTLCVLDGQNLAFCERVPKWSDRAVDHPLHVDRLQWFQ